MNECVIYNKYALLNLKVKYKFIIIFSILLFLIIIFSSIFYKAYDSFKVSGIYLNNEINVTVLESDVKKLLDSKYLEVNGVKYKFSILSVSRLEQEVITNSYYQTIKITIAEKFLENEILDVTFYKNKQRIIQKVFNLLK